jgi:hypothetical protein
MTAAPQLLPEQPRLGAEVAAAGEEDSHTWIQRAGTGKKTRGSCSRAG